MLKEGKEHPEALQGFTGQNLPQVQASPFFADRSNVQGEHNLEGTGLAARERSQVSKGYLQLHEQSFRQDLSIVLGARTSPIIIPALTPAPNPPTTISVSLPVPHFPHQSYSHA